MSTSALGGPCLLAVSHLAVLRALEIAGKRMLSPSQRGRFPNTPCHELHTVLPPCPQVLMDKVLEGCFALLPYAMDPTQAAGLTHRLESYVRLLLLTRTLHNINDLPAVLKEPSRGRARVQL